MILITLLLHLLQPALALQVDHLYVSQPKYQELVKVTCESFEGDKCQALCGNAWECQKPQAYCRNCVGTTSNLLRTLFVQFKNLYDVSGYDESSEKLLRLLQDSRYHLVAPASLYNFYNAVDAAELVSTLKNMCPQNTEKPLLLLELDNSRSPYRLTHLICRDQAGQSVAWVLRKRTAEKASEIELDLN